MPTSRDGRLLQIRARKAAISIVGAPIPLRRFQGAIMVLATTSNWSSAVVDYGQAWTDVSHRAKALPGVDINPPEPPLPEDDKKKHTKEPVRSLYPRPSSGRTTAMGRRMERPGESKPGGPSGQTDGAKDGKHTNG